MGHETEPEPTDRALLEFVWQGLQISIESKLRGRRGLTEEQAREILAPLEPSDDMIET